MLNSLLVEIKNKLKKINNKDRCFVIGNGPSVSSIDLSLFDSEVTICCNQFMEGIADKGISFVPTILCCNDPNVMKTQIRNNFQFDKKNSYNKIKDKLIYIYHPSFLIRNCYDIESWSPLCKHPGNLSCQPECPFVRAMDISNFQHTIDNNRNMYLIKDLESFVLTQNIHEMLGSSSKDIDRKVQIQRNFQYCNKYHNIVPLLSMLIAQQLGFKNIYLVGCDGANLDKHFYAMSNIINTQLDDRDTHSKNKYYSTIYTSMRTRCEEYRDININITNCSNDSIYDFIYKLDLPLFIRSMRKAFTLKSVSNNLNNIIDIYDQYCKIKYYGKNKNITDNNLDKLVIDGIITDNDLITYITADKIMQSLDSSDILISRIKTIIQMKNNKNRCFIIGNLSKMKNFDFNLLKDEITIGCNYILEDIAKNNIDFTPTIICGENGNMLSKKIKNDFNDQDAKYNNNIISIYSPASLITNCYDINTWKSWDEHPDGILYKPDYLHIKPEDLGKFQEIINDNSNIFLIKDLTNFELTNNIYDMIGLSPLDTRNKNLIKENLNYCHKYVNTIPTLSLLLAEKFGIKNIYLIGCDTSDLFDNSYDSNLDFYNAMKTKCNDMHKNNFNIVNCSLNNSYDFLLHVNIQKIISDINEEKINTTQIIEKIDNYCKIQSLIKNNDKMYKINKLISEDIITETSIQDYIHVNKYMHE